MRNLNVSILLAGLLLLNSQPFAYSDWQNFDPGGGGANFAVNCHPTDSNIVWVATDLNGYHRSTDGGRTWHFGTNQIQLQTEGVGNLWNSLFQFAMDPSDPNVCYFAVYSRRWKGGPVYKQGIWKSTDKGTTWSFLTAQYSDSLSGASLIVDYAGNLLCAQNGKTRNFYVSADKGKSFVKKPPLPFVTAPLSYGHESMAVSRQNWAYIAHPYSNGLYYSTNLGSSWNTVATFSDKKVASIACSPKNEKVVVVLTRTGDIYQSMDGKVFTKTGKIRSDGGAARNYHGLGSIGINGKGTVIATGFGGSWAISHDKGKTFDAFRPKITENDWIFKSTINRMACHMLSASPVSGHWYGAMAGYTFQSTNNGTTWAVRCKGIQIINVNNPVVVDAGNPNRVHGGAGDVGHYYTTDLGKTWKTSELHWNDVSGLAQDPKNHKIFYKMNGWHHKHATSNWIQKSTDRGETWDHIATWSADSLKRAYGGLAVDPTNSSRLYFGTKHRNAVWMSENGGKTFTKMPSSPGDFTGISVTKNGNVFGIGGGPSSGSLYKYEKNFKKWHRLHAKISGYAVHPKNELVIFAAVGTHHENCGAAPGRLEKSTNGGGSWKVIKDAKGKDFSPWALHIDPTNPDVMLMSTFHHREDNGIPSGVMRSLDGGKTWHTVNNNHGPTNDVRGIVYGGIPGRAYAWHKAGGGISRIDNLHIAKFEGKPSIEAAPGLAPVQGSFNARGYSNGRFNYSVASSDIRGQLVKLGIYDVQGRLVRILVNQRQAAGYHHVAWNGADALGRAVSAGMRFYRLEAAGVTETVRAMVR